ncbi:unnamed protein product [Trifolium pratense]|uniref:Uncharacterized protein n=1 Tax=Trifolium pratense TaxID=57577 RepID=A0ACB0J2U7_TRIPR|nr:unnamed protein product [Trifolium pratense]
MSTSGSVAQSSQAATSQSIPSASLQASLQSSRRKTNPAWDHVTYTEEGRKKTYTCMFCLKVFKGGGIHRVKEHLAGVVGEVKSCPDVDEDTRFRMQESLNETATKKKKVAEMAERFDNENPFGPNVVDLANDTSEIPAAVVPSSSRPTKKRATASQSQGLGKSFFAPRTTPGAQPKIKSVLAGKKVVHNVDIAIATFFFENCIPMNAFNSSSYQPMIDAIASIGGGYKGPNYHAMRTVLLSDMTKNVQLLVDSCRSQWAE